MEKGNLSQQTAERLYTMIAVEGRLAPGRSCPTRWSCPRSWGSAAPPCGRPSAPWLARGCWRSAGAGGPLSPRRAAQVEDFGFADLDRVQGQLRDLFELRAIFEPQAARLACRRATEEELAEILAQGEAVDRCIRQGRTGRRPTGTFTPPSSGPPTTNS